MYTKITDGERMTADEAAARYPDMYLLFHAENMNTLERVGKVKYIGDKFGELLDLQIASGDPVQHYVIEGINLPRSIGGIAIDT
jgi:methyl coenzyme M reductase gamma subunit